MSIVSKKVKELQGTSPDEVAHRESIWCVVANVVDEHPYGEDQEIQRGTKHFAPGTKVYCFPALWGDGYEKIRVIGRHRGSKRFVTMVMASKWLTNWRVKLVYSPHIVSKMRRYWDDSTKAKVQAETLVNSLKEIDKSSID